MSLDDLVAAIDGQVSKQALSKYERGKMQPTAAVAQSNRCRARGQVRPTVDRTGLSCRMPRLPQARTLAQERNGTD